MKKTYVVIICLFFTSVSAMELTPEQKEAAFNARMMAMREEQARRTTTESNIQQNTTPTANNYGIPQEYLYNPTKTEKGKEKPKELTAFVTDSCTPDLEKSYVSRGFKKVHLSNGRIGFCKPGCESHLALFETAHAHNTRSQQDQ